MTNQELTIIILDKLGWDYDKELNPNRYSISRPLWAGILIEAILDTKSIPKAASKIGFATKAVNTAISNFFIPIFGKLNGGNEGWRFKLLNYIEYQACSKCHVLKSYSEYHLDSTKSTERHSICKICRVELNASNYKKDSTKEAHKRSYEKNYSNILARNTIYKGERGKRVPKWADLDDISKIYRECPKDMHVDHELPLKGELVSGLHVVDNLQYLTVEENLKKSNKIDLIEYNKRVYNS